MSDPQQIKDEAVEETFISHLVELRDRIIRAGASVIVVFIGLVYWAPDIFRLLARPLMQNLPKDGKMIVTDVTGSFFVPMKVTMLVALRDRAADRAVSDLGVRRAGALPAREEAGRAAGRQQLHAVPVRHGVRVLRRVSRPSSA